MAPSAVIDLTAGFAAYKEKLQAKSPQFCKDLARRARELEREAGELRSWSTHASWQDCVPSCTGNRVSAIELAGLTSSTGRG